MKNKKLTAFLMLAVITVFMLSFCLFYSKKVYSDAYSAQKSTRQDDISPMSEEMQTEADNVPPATDDGEETLSDRVKAYLQSVYGEDYEKYYNDIVDKWGSVENYLLNASENLPEEYKYKATELLTTVNAYIGVAADGILLLFAAIYIVCRRKKDKQINTDLNKLKALDNQIEVAQLAIINSQKAQTEVLKSIIPVAKYDSMSTIIAESEKSLESAAEEVKKIV